MGYVCGDNTNRNTKLAILKDLKGKFLNILIFGKGRRCHCEEEGVKGDAKSEYLWCIDLLGNNPIVVSMEFMCQSISQKEMTNLN